MLKQNTNILAIVGYGMDALFSARKVVLWDMQTNQAL